MSAYQLLCHIYKKLYTIFTRVLVDLVYKSTPHFQGQKWNFSSFRGKQMKFTPIEISQNVHLFFLRMY